MEDGFEDILPESAKGRGVMVSGTCVHGGGDFSCVDSPDFWVLEMQNHETNFSKDFSKVCYSKVCCIAWEVWNKKAI